MSKVVIVTGGSGGLGGAIATEFGLTGAKVVICDIAFLDEAEGVAKKINEGGGETFIYKADVRNYSQLKAMVEATLDRWQRIDVLVNNAGGGTPLMGLGGAPLTEMAEEVWDRVVDTNLKGTFLCIKAVAPQMMKQKEGHIINVSSGAGLRGDKNSSPYAAAKAGVIGLTKSAARELGDYNVKVNAVCPGRILHERSLGQGRRPRDYEEETVLHRATGSAQEFAKFVVYLSSMENISGQTLNLDSRILF
ncbi:SDR family NAD(P)-dependent oxidoreductase [Chloroflexota bacterium]